MAKNFFISNILFIALTLSLIFPIQADAVLIGGQVFTDEGFTPIDNGKTIRLKINGAGDYTCPTFTFLEFNGVFWWDIAYTAGDILTVFIDGEAENENITVTVTTGSEVVSDTFEIEMVPSLLDE